MYDDGSLDPLVKFVLGVIAAVVAAKMLWRWLTQDVAQWVTADAWGWITGHLWWSSLIIATLLLFVLAARRSAPGDFEVYYGGNDVAEDEETALTYSLGQLAAMSSAGFEQACADLLARDGFIRPRRIGGAGDLGADVIAWTGTGDKIVVQCKQYSRPVGSKEAQTFNGTARPEHGASLALMVGLNGFTKIATEFAARHDITLIDRAALESWAQGEHLYAVIGEDRSAA
ncbi:restriction endonuclease [Streptomyces umbrinus]|uniref:restriction endonuclease n=1 Tax=Streptomyces umbrinus TaxID=67370 RepID=UPI0033ED08D0